MKQDAEPVQNGHHDLGDARYDKLELLAEKVAREIARRDAMVEAEKQRVANDEAALKKVANDRVGAWVEYERIKCGKKTCRCALSDCLLHGPYWYVYTPSLYTESGRTSEYAGMWMNIEAAKIYARHEEKRKARDELLKGELRRMRIADELLGFSLEEVCTEDFTDEERATVERKRKRQRERQS